MFHIHGDVDRVVPIESNSAELARRYRRFGGEMALKVIKGQGHNMWTGWFVCQELVDFVIARQRVYHDRLRPSYLELCTVPRPESSERSPYVRSADRLSQSSTTPASLQ